MQSSVSVCLFLLVSTVSAEVVVNFEQCNQYFYKNHVPQWPASGNHIHICQKFGNRYHYATLYDKSNRIPVYSAYTVETNERISDQRWMIEPQLVDQNYEQDMMTEASLIYHHKGLEPSVIGQTQALNEDYKKSPTEYNRGHLNPDSHHAGDSAKATYTLTNVVPQRKKLNGGKWKDHEDKLQNLAKDNQVFVLAGAIPSTGTGNWINETHVNIPDYMWVTYCYFDKESNSFKSGGATAKNTENILYECSLRQLQEFLTTHIQQVELFHEDCYEKESAGASATAENPCKISIIKKKS